MVIGGIVFMISAKLKVTNNVEIQKNGLEALKNALGVTGTIKFLERFDHGGCGDYTKEKYEYVEREPSDGEIRQMFGF